MHAEAGETDCFKLRIEIETAVRQKQYFLTANLMKK